MIVDWCVWAAMLLTITYGLTGASLTSPVRIWVFKRSITLGVLVACPICAGTWIGLALGATPLYPGPYHVGGSVVLATALLLFVRKFLLPEQAVLALEDRTRTEIIQERYKVRES